METIDQAVLRILQLKAEIGLFDLHSVAEGMCLEKQDAVLAAKRSQLLDGHIHDIRGGAEELFGHTVELVIIFIGVGAKLTTEDDVKTVTGGFLEMMIAVHKEIDLPIPVPIVGVVEFFVFVGEAAEVVGQYQRVVAGGGVAVDDQLHGGFGTGTDVP